MKYQESKKQKDKRRNKLFRKQKQAEDRRNKRRDHIPDELLVERAQLEAEFLRKLREE